MRFFILLLPWLELFTLIQLGTKTSALTALAYVFGTLVLGVLILRHQGRGVVEKLRQSSNGRILGPQLLLDDMAVGLAGLLLIIPGVLTDVAALVVLIGPLRRRLVAWFRPAAAEPFVADREPGEHIIIEGDYQRVDQPGDSEQRGPR